MAMIGNVRFDNLPTEMQWMILDKSALNEVEKMYAVDRKHCTIVQNYIIHLLKAGRLEEFGKWITDPSDREADHKFKICIIGKPSEEHIKRVFSGIEMLQVIRTRLRKPDEEEPMDLELNFEALRRRLNYDMGL